MNTTRAPALHVLALTTASGALIYTGAQTIGFGERNLGLAELLAGAALFVAASLVRR